MKVLPQSSTTPLMFRLTSSLGNWLINARNLATGKAVPFIGTDVSPDSRYQLFNTREAFGSNFPLTSNIELRPSGWWEFDIYDQTSATNLDIDSVDGSLLWTEKVKVIKTDDLGQPESGS